MLVVTSVQTYDNGLCKYLESLGLPADRVLVGIDDRRKVINTLPDAIDRLPPEKRGKAYYVSKLVAACGAGLFDAGLAYLWDAVVASLRERVARFDLDYFYDSAVPASERSRFKTEDDLQNLDDSKLVNGCHTCGILTDVGYKLLDHIRDMRNWASAAHPNNAEIGGIQLMGWLETCVKEVFAVDVTGPAVVAQQLLRNLRDQTLAAGDVAPIVAKLATLPSETAAALLRSAVGLYSDLKLDQRVVQNIRLVAAALWTAAPEESRYEVGLKYAALSVNAEIQRRDRVREFLDLVGGLTYLPTDNLALEIQEKLAQLEAAHFDLNNFYTEPPLARELQKLVPHTGAVPPAANDNYVRVLMLAKVGRNSGTLVAVNANPAYDAMLTLFTDAQLRVFVALPYDARMQAKIAYGRLAQRFIEVAQWLSKRTANQGLVAALSYIGSRTVGQAAGLANDSHYRQLLQKIL